LAFDGFDIYLSHKSDSIYSLDSKNGDTNWRNADLQYRRITNPIKVGNHIAIGDFDGYIHLLNTETGAIEGRAQITSSVPVGKNIHAIGEDKILGADEDGNVFYLQINNISDETVEDINNDKNELQRQEYEAIQEDLTTEATEAVTNEMCDVDEGDIRNKGNKKRQNCY